MIYLYKCPYCSYEVHIEKPNIGSSRVEYCEICEGELKRVYEPIGIRTNDGVKY